MSAAADPLSRMERLLGRLLIAGVLVSAVLLALGLLMWLANQESSAAMTLLDVGLVVLMATPIMRVMVSFAEYLRMRRWFFAAVTVAVLTELAVTVIVALSRR